jgi:hypothetical protein
MKNDSKHIHTWIKHHIWQGVEHFYLIEDNSNDNTKENLQEYIDIGIVTYYFRPGPKVNNYRWVFEKIKKTTEWVAICDVNEYFYGVEMSLCRKLDEFKDTNLILCNLY